jgi:hypothetical protein
LKSKLPKPAQTSPNQPKSQILLHKKSPSQDYIIGTLTASSGIFADNFGKKPQVIETPQTIVKIAQCKKGKKIKINLKVEYLRM